MALDWAALLYQHWINDEPQHARAAWDQLVLEVPEEQRPHLTYGNVLRDLNAFEAADEAYGRARRFGDRAHRIAVAWNHSQILIGLEQYHRAYALAEERLLQPQADLWRPAPHWEGWPLAGTGTPRPAGSSGRLTVWSEQGIGDSLQYLRWIPRLIELGYAVRLELDPPLLPLVRQGLAWLGPQLELVAKGIAPTPLADPCQGSLLSLPALLGGAPLARAFQTGAAPAAPVRGYLRSADWTSGDSARRRPRIGLVWSSGRKLEHPFVVREYVRRSLPVEFLMSLLEGLAAEDVDLVSLQFGPDRERASGWSGTFAAILSDDLSLAQTAGWLAALDLVISVDTATAHLAGAMALQAWVLLPWASDPRWLRERSDSPWYPTLQLLRQPRAGDWEGLVQSLLNRFRDWRGRWCSDGVGR